MPNSFFQFKQFVVQHDRCAMKVTTDSCLFGAWVSRELQGLKPDSRLLDIGAGTGLLSLMIAQKHQTKIESVEIDEGAAAQAKENVASSQWSNRIEIIHADIKQWKPETKYDWIVSNPPFYETALRSDNQKKNIAHHDAGLKLEELFAIIAKHLTDDGKFYLLLPANREKEVDDLCVGQTFFLSKKISVRQTANHSPFRLIIEGQRKYSESLVDEISIKDAQGNYTSAFVSLLKDYYLYL